MFTSEADSNPKPSDQGKRVALKYLLLAPAESFRDIAEDAKAVVLAGGTMAPVRVFILLLLAELDLT